MTLTQEQITSYHQNGYLLASGLIPNDVSARAETAMWNLMEMDANDPTTWSRVPKTADEYTESRGVVIFNGAQDPDLLACATTPYLTAVAQLLGEPVGSLHPPEAVHTQNLLQQNVDWKMPKPHVDGIPKEHMHKTFPGPYRITSLFYLSDVDPQGGGTCAWPGSHIKIRQLAESNPTQYTYLYDLNKDIPTLDLGDPIELTPKRGDILFFQHLFGHNGSANTHPKPRFMMRFFCSCEKCFNKWKKVDHWGHWAP
jgi:ectoine hydroxylase-related dioxygenase (phytanoyl-CoA dioxygenase family)